MKLVPFNSHFAVNPIRGFEALDRLFDNPFFERKPNGDEKTVWYPALDWSETENGYHIVADLPGVAKEDIEISVKDGVLILQGERKSETKETGEGFSRVERWSGSYHRRIALPRDVDSGRIEASYDNGVLTLLVPKSEAAKARKIEIKS